MYKNKRSCEDAARGRDEVAGQSEPVDLKSCLIRVQAAPQRSVVSYGPSGDVLADGINIGVVLGAMGGKAEPEYESV